MNAKRRHESSVLVGVILLAAGLTGLRLIHLGADTPPGLSFSAAPYVDEGYKTLAARNLILFGSTQWHPDDSYPGWMKLSPLTQWSYYGAFRTLGPCVESARIVSLLWFALLLVTYGWAMRRRYPPPLLFGGLAVLGLESTLYLYSRLALFEIPLASLLCVLLFVLVRMQPKRTIAPFLLIAGGGILGACLIKPSFLIYVASALTGLLMSQQVHTRSFRKAQLPLLLALGVIFISLFLAFDWEFLVRRIQMDPFKAAARTLLNPSVAASPAVVLAGLLCVFHALLCSPQRWLEDPYRASLTGLVLFSPILLALFPYNPLRYYVPILPAYILVAVEWVALRRWHEAVPARVAPPKAVLFWGGLAVLFFYGVLALDKQMLVRLPFSIGEDPGLSDGTLLRIVLPVALVVAGAMWRWREHVMGARSLILAAAALLLTCGLHTSLELWSFWVHPRYDAKRIRADLTRLVSDEEILAGDWAPFFALGTSIRALYVSRYVNVPEHLYVLKPDFFLHSDTVESRAVIEVLQKQEGVDLEGPIYRSMYGGRGVALYRFHYPQALGRRE